MASVRRTLAVWVVLCLCAALRSDVSDTSDQLSRGEASGGTWWSRARFGALSGVMADGRARAAKRRAPPPPPPPPPSVVPGSYDSSGRSGAREWNQRGSDAMGAGDVFVGGGADMRARGGEAPVYPYTEEGVRTSTLLRLSPELLEFGRLQLCMAHVEVLEVLHTGSRERTIDSWVDSDNDGVTDTKEVARVAASAPVDLYSVSVENEQFYVSLFSPGTLRAGEKTSVHVVVLARVVGRIRGRLNIHTSEGIVSCELEAEGIESAYRLKPLIGFTVAVGMKWAPSVTLYNPHREELVVKEVFTTEAFLRLATPKSSVAGNHGSEVYVADAAWKVKSHTTATVINLLFQSQVAARYLAYVHIRTSHDDLLLPVEITTLRGGILASPASLSLGAFAVQPTHGIVATMLAPHVYRPADVLRTNLAVEECEKSVTTEGDHGVVTVALPPECAVALSNVGSRDVSVDLYNSGVASVALKDAYVLKPDNRISIVLRKARCAYAPCVARRVLRVVLCGIACRTIPWALALRW